VTESFCMAEAVPAPARRSMVTAAAAATALASTGCQSSRIDRAADETATETANAANNAAARPDAEVTALLAQLDTLRAAAHIPGMAVAVLRDGQVEALQGLGLANVEAGVATTADTPFDIASVSKPIAGVVALQLAQDGQLDLDRPMQSFAGFAQFCAAARAEPGPFFRDVDCDHPRLTLRAVLSMSANGEPGTRFFYNPPLFSWASRPMAQASGTPFSTLVQARVFDVAGMTRSARRHRALPLRADLAADLAPPYRIDADGRPQRNSPPPPQGDGAAGGVISTARDLARFDQALDEGRLLTAAARRELQRPAAQGLPYGLGWFLGDAGVGSGTRAVIWHSGLWEERYSALYLKLLPVRGRRSATLILLANSDGLRWESRMNEATLARSPFAQAFLQAMA
jgi:CubicO group peptidase (beta-lactamase class C family)